MNSTRIPLLGVLGLAAVLAACGTEAGVGPDPTDNTGNQTTDGDETPPTIISIVPVDGATSVELDAQVRVTFSEPVDAASVTSSSFSVGGSNGTITVSGAVATYEPNNPFAAGIDHTVNISTSVADLAGNTLASSFTASFTTRDPVPTIARAGSDDDVAFSSTVTLDGSGSEGENLTYLWTQLTGSDVGMLSGASPSFTAPASVQARRWTIR